MKAYLTHSNLYHPDDSLFRTALLFYPDLYLSISLANLKWTELDRAGASIYGQKWPTKFPIMAASEEHDSVTLTFKRYFQHNPELYGSLAGRFHEARALDADTNRFFEIAFDVPLRLARSTTPTASASPLFNINVFKRMSTILRSWGFSELDWYGRIDLVVMHQELFVSNFLSRTKSLQSLMTASEMLMKKSLLEGPDLDLWENDPHSVLKQFFPFETLHEMLGAVPHERGGFEINLQELLVPDLASIPLNDFAEFIRKDKARPIAEYVNALVSRFPGQLGTSAIAEEIAEQLFKVFRVFSPSIKDVTIAILGNIPSPILVNPVSLLGAIATIKSYLGLRRDYAWALAVSSLRQASHPKRTFGANRQIPNPKSQSQIGFSVIKREPKQLSYFSTNDVAKQLGIAHTTLRRYIALGKVPAPGITRIGKRDLRAWSEEDVDRVRALLPRIVTRSR